MKNKKQIIWTLPRKKTASHTKKLMLAIGIVLFSLPKAYASVCDNSQIFIKNATGETLVLGNVNTNPIFFAIGIDRALGQPSTANDYTRIQPNSSLQFTVSSARATLGDARISFDVGGTYGNSKFVVYFERNGVLFNSQCKAYAEFASGNPKHYSINKSLTDGKHAEALFTIKSVNVSH